jgi:hypothetical protein
VEFRKRRRSVRADGFVVWKAVRTTIFSEAAFLAVLVNARDVRDLEGCRCARGQSASAAAWSLAGWIGAYEDMRHSRRIDAGFRHFAHALGRCCKGGNALVIDAWRCRRADWGALMDLCSVPLPPAVPNTDGRSALHITR